MFEEEKKEEMPVKEFVKEPIEEKPAKKKPWYEWRDDDDESIEEKRARERAYRINPTS